MVVGAIPRQAPGFLPLTDLLADLEQSDTGVSVLTGVPGVGMTQLATAYAQAKLAGGWRLVAWVNAGDTASLLGGLAAVADAVGLSGGPGRDAADAGSVVRRWLEADGDRCLLVFDDAEDPDVLRPFVPTSGAARVLITTIRQSVADLGSSVPVDAFSADESVEFLTETTGLEQGEAAALAAELGHLPLALAQAATIVGQLGYETYLGQLRLLQAGDFLTGEDGELYPPGVARAMTLALDAAQASDRTGMCSKVLEIIAVLSTTGIRRELLHAAGQAGVLAPGGRRVAASLVDRALEELADRSLLSFSLDGQVVIMHRLVTWMVREELARRDQLTAVCRAVASVLEVCAKALVGSQDRSSVRDISQQVTALLKNTPTSAANTDNKLATVLLRLRFMALYQLIELGDSAPQAIAVGRSLTADLERLLGPNHPDTLNSRNSLAAAYLAAGRPNEAVPLFEQVLAIRQRLQGLDHPDTLNSQNNLAAAYQDASRTAEAIQLYEVNLAVRERLLGAEHPSTLNSRGNLATAYRDGGRADEAIPLFEQNLADRERVLGPDHPDTQTSRKNLAAAYQDAGLSNEAVPLLEQTSVGWQKRAAAYRDGARAAEANPAVEQAPTARGSKPASDAAEQVLASFRRPPADPARHELPSAFRRPPADPARQAFPKNFTLPAAKPTARANPGRTQEQPPEDVYDDREVVAAIAAGHPAGIAIAYDRYAPALYGYCYWMLRDPADAAAALQDTFVIAAAMSGDLSDSSKLRPWLYAVARSECRRRPQAVSAALDEKAAAADQQAEAISEPADATVTFRAVRPLSEAISEPADATVTFRAVRPLSEAISEPADATVTFRAVRPLSEAISEPADATVTFRAVRPPTNVVPEMLEATMPFRAIRPPPDLASALPRADGELGQAELHTLIRSILADLKPRERETVELSFRHDLFDDDLAIALGLSVSRAHALASRTRGRLEQSLAALRTALAIRQACPVMGELLADWDGQLSEQTRDLVAWHIEQCQTCVNQARGSLRPTVLSGLLPLTPLPGELRAKVLSRCSSTSEEAVAYRRRVVRRAESTWAAMFSQAIRRLSWGSIRANPGRRSSRRLPRRGSWRR